MRRKVHWRTISLSLVGACLLVVASLSGTGAQPNSSGNRAASAPKVHTPTKRTGKLAGIVDLAKTPTLTPNSQAPAIIAPVGSGDPLTPEQRQAYEKSQRANPQVKNPYPNTYSGDGKSPAFVGGGVTPLVTKNVDGLTSAQVLPGLSSPAIATDLSYVMEGMSRAVAIYRASTGALAYGPYDAASFFAPVSNSGDFFGFPQMYYDTMRDRWVVAMLQGHNGVPYLDIAISVSNSPTQPTPGGQYYIYQLSADFEPNPPAQSTCERMTMGMDYWGLYFACANDRVGTGFVGNTMLAVSKADMYSGGDSTAWLVNDGLQRATGAPAFAVSPAIEEGVQDAEFFLSTDVGFGVVSSNMGLCAWTNLSNMTTTPPTVSCQKVDLGLPYDDPLQARQPSTSSIQPSYGPKQIYYKTGRLYFAQTTALGGNHDGAYWVEVQPQLTTKAAQTPQWVNGAIVRQAAYFDFGSSYDLYNPTLMGTDENDITLVYNISDLASLKPSIEMSGRKATDADGTLGQGGAHVRIVTGAHTVTSTWSEFSSCAIPLNSVTRGTIWCAYEYPGSVADPGWNTRLFSFRAE